MKLYIDVETRSGADIAKTGSYKYIEDSDFKVLLLAYALDDNPVQVIDLTVQDIPAEFIAYLKDPSVELHAWNAQFERTVFNKILPFKIPLTRWFCSMAKSSMAGFPLQLAKAGEALGITAAKLATGKDLITLFCTPKPVKETGLLDIFGRDKEKFNNPKDYPEEWAEFKIYNRFDVEAEREIDNALSYIKTTQLERNVYLLDQTINDRGVKADLALVRGARNVGEWEGTDLRETIARLTGVNNPNSGDQLKTWLETRTGVALNGMDKDSLKEALGYITDAKARTVIQSRLMLNKTSLSKFDAIHNAVQKDNRVRGLFQYYGARTGRWAGRRVQLQNLPRNNIEGADLDLARDLILRQDWVCADLLYGNVNSLLSQLIRTALVAPEGKLLCVADFSAIEARVLAWLAGEVWRLKVFAGHGKIYEASASMMFGVPIERIDKGSDLRGKGKIAELALGYQGAVGALKQMGGANMGLSETEMKQIVEMWRAKSPNIRKFWYDIDKAAIKAVKYGTTTQVREIRIGRSKKYMYIALPSGRKLYYNNPEITQNAWGKDAVTFRGLNDKGQYCQIDTYGGKLVENITQAVARDILCVAMLRLHKKGYALNMHVHDEAVAEVDAKEAPAALKEMCRLMCLPIKWARGLPLNADGFYSKYYKK